MSIDPFLALASFGIGIVVGLTGMGGGALMTPVLVLFFNVAPLAAVSSDLVASAVMKPVGSFVHLRRGTVHLGLVKWLCIGSIPGAFSGVLIARSLGRGEDVQQGIRFPTVRPRCSSVPGGPSWSACSAASWWGSRRWARARSSSLRSWRSIPGSR